MSEMIKYIEVLIMKAAEAKDSADAMRFSQSALNATNALVGLQEIPTQSFTSTFTSKAPK